MDPLIMMKRSVYIIAQYAQNVKRYSYNFGIFSFCPV